MSPFDFPDPPAEVPKRSPFPAIASRALAMMARDRQLLIKLYPLLVAVPLWETLARPLSPAIGLGASLCNEVVSAFFFSLIVLLWFEREGLRPARGGVPLIIAFHVTSWILISLPSLFSLLALPSAFLLVATFLSTVGIFLTFRLFFFFIPVTQGERSLRGILSQAFSLGSGRLTVVLGLLVPSLAISAVVSGIVAGFSPDGRSPVIAVLLALSGGVFPLLFSYLGISAALGIVKPSTAPVTLTGIRTALTPRGSIIILIFALIVWSGNIVRFWSSPPAPQFRLLSASFEPPRTMRLSVALADTEYEFRGFRPVFLRLAGESGAPLSANPSEAVLVDSKQDVLMMVPPLEQADLALTFEVIDRAEDIPTLEDLYLWYGNNKILLIPRENRAIIESRGAAR